MELKRENGELRGIYSQKDLQWMADVAVPMADLAPMINETKDDAMLGEVFRLLGEGVLLARTQKKLKHPWAPFAAMLVSENLPDAAVISVLRILAHNGLLRFDDDRDSKKAFKAFTSRTQIPDELRSDLVALWQEIERRGAEA